MNLSCFTVFIWITPSQFSFLRLRISWWQLSCPLGKNLNCKGLSLGLVSIPMPTWVLSPVGTPPDPTLHLLSDEHSKWLHISISSWVRPHYMGHLVIRRLASVTTTRSFMYKCCIRTKTLCTLSFMLTVRCTKSEMNVRICVHPFQLHVWHMHVSNGFSQLTTLRDDAVNLLTLGFGLQVCCTACLKINKSH